MKYGIQSNVTSIDELSAMRIFKKLRENSLKENEGGVHVREIENGHIGKTIEKF